MKTNVWLNSMASELDSIAEKRSVRRILLLGSFPKWFLRKCRSVAETEVQTIAKDFSPERIDDPIGMIGDIDFPSSHFDVVFSMDWIEQSSWMNWALREMRRVLVFGGLAHVTLQLNQNSRKRNKPITLAHQAIGLCRRVCRRLGLRRIANRLVTQTSAISTIEDLEHALSRIRFRFELHSDSRRQPNWLLNVLSVGSFQRCVVKLKAVEFADVSCENLASAELVAVAEAEFGEQLQARDALVYDNKHKPALTLGGLPRRALVLSPHPDDELIGAGGTILKILQAGGDCKVLQMTNGRSAVALSRQAESLKKIVRVNEAQVVAQELGVELECWDDCDDGVFKSTPELISRLTDTLNAFQPDAVFLPFVTDAHPDHVVSNVIFSGALENLTHNCMQSVFGYEVWSFCRHNFTVDVTDMVQVKRDLISKYRTAMRPVDYAWRWELAAAYHMQKQFGSKGYLEVFSIHSPSDYKDLVKELTNEQ